MNRTFRAALIASAIVLVSILPAAAESWDIDSSHSAAQFSVKHLAISNVRGEFHNVKGTVEWDGKSPAGVKIDASIDMTTVDTRDAKRDEHLKGPDFFDAAKFPTMTFKSKKASASGPGKMKIVGDLTLRGVTKEVTLDVDGPTAAIKDPWGNLKVGATATTKINRQDFGVSWSKTLDSGGLVVGNDVDIVLDIEIGRKAPAEKK